jgi:membrane protein
MTADQSDGPNGPRRSGRAGRPPGDVRATFAREAQEEASARGDVAGAGGPATSAAGGKAWWRRVNDIRKGVSARSKRDSLGLVAAGVAFYGMLAVFPAIIAAVSVYALVADPSSIKSQLDPLIKTLPPGGGDLLVGQLTATASSSHSGVSIGVIIGIAGTLFAASGGVRALMNGLNVIFERTESRNFIKLLVFSLALTVGALVIGIVALALIAAVPVVLDHVGLGAFAAVLAQIGRWIALLVVIGGSLALFYQYGTDRGGRHRPRFSIGAAVAIVIWLVGSLLFSLYVSNFSSYNKTYGALAAVIVLLLWLDLSAYAVLYGAAVDAEIAARASDAGDADEPRAGDAGDAGDADEPPAGDAGDRS